MLSPRRWSSATPGASDPPADQCIEVEFPSGALGIGFCDAIRHAAFSLQIEDFPRHAGVPGAAEAYSASVEAGSKLRQGMALVAINSNSCNCAGLDYDDTVALLKRARASGVSRLRFFGGVSSAAGEVAKTAAEEMAGRARSVQPTNCDSEQIGQGQEAAVRAGNARLDDERCQRDEVEDCLRSEVSTTKRKLHILATEFKKERQDRQTAEAAVAKLQAELASIKAEHKAAIENSTCAIIDLQFICDKAAGALEEERQGKAALLKRMSRLENELTEKANELTEKASDEKGLRRALSAQELLASATGRTAAACSVGDDVDAKKRSKHEWQAVRAQNKAGWLMKTSLVHKSHSRWVHKATALFGRQTWSRRYCVLDATFGAHLVYFESEEEAGELFPADMAARVHASHASPAKRTINLGTPSVHVSLMHPADARFSQAPASVRDDLKNTFEVRSVGKSYFFACGSPAELAQWIDAISTFREVALAQRELVRRYSLAESAAAESAGHAEDSDGEKETAAREETSNDERRGVLAVVESQNVGGGGNTALPPEVEANLGPPRSPGRTRSNLRPHSRSVASGRSVRAGRDPSKSPLSSWVMDMGRGSKGSVDDMDASMGIAGARGRGASAALDALSLSEPAMKLTSNSTGAYDKGEVGGWDGLVLGSPKLNGGMLRERSSTR